MELYRAYKKSTSAYYPPFPSASLSSANKWFNPYTLVSSKVEVGGSSEYTLNDLLGCPPGSNHQESYEAIKGWLTKRLSLTGGESISIDREVADAHPLWTSTHKRPDLQIVSTTNHVLVQVEVDSSNKDSTIRKLTLGLIDQLRWLRNHTTSITKCSGFYFMNHRSGGQVIQVVLEWVDNEWMFLQNPNRLQKESVVAMIRQALNDARVSLRLALAAENPTDHALPISGSFIHGNFGAVAEQFPSGQSVVIIDVVGGKAYKRCLDPNEEIRLLRLRDCNPKPSRSVFPDGSQVVVNDYISFFQYPLLKPPLTPQQAKDNASRFVKLVCEAIQELHDSFNIAHLDVRLANICLTDTDDLDVKLIDLDRSEQASKLFEYSIVSTNCRASVMYNADNGWTLGQLDWRQLGIMVYAFLNNITGNSYHSQQPMAQSDFLRHLLKDGDYVPALREAWDPKEDSHQN